MLFAHCLQLRAQVFSLVMHMINILWSYSYETFVFVFVFLFFQSNCYSRVITVDGQKKIIIFASRRYLNCSFSFLSSHKFRIVPLKTIDC